MINTFVLTPNERILSWRDLRGELLNLTFEEQLEKVSCFWWQAPIVTFVLDFDRPETWPPPWEIIHQNMYDSTARAYMMAETFLLAYEEIDDKPFDKIELCYIKDNVESDMMMIVCVDGWVLNHQYNSVIKFSDIEKQVDIYSVYQKIGKGWEIV